MKVRGEAEEAHRAQTLGDAALAMASWSASNWSPLLDALARPHCEANWAAQGLRLTRENGLYGASAPT